MAESTVAFDGANKLILGLQGVTYHDVEINWYSAWKMWLKEDDNTKYLPAIRSVGGDVTDPINDKRLGSTFFLMNGWKFKPYGEDADIVIEGNIRVDNTEIYGDNVWVKPNGSYSIGITFQVSNLTDAQVLESELSKSLDYQGIVYLDVSSEYAGTDYPNGTSTRPVNNLDDAIAIANTVGCRSLLIIGDIVLNKSFQHWVFKGINTISSVDINGQAVSNCSFVNLIVKGEFNGPIKCKECSIDSSINLQGEFRECGFEPGLHILSTSPINAAVLFSCFSNGGQDEPVILDCADGSAVQCTIRSFSGILKLINVDDVSDKIAVDLDSGAIIIDNSCTGGTIEIRGVGRIEDNSNGTTIVTDGFISKGGVLSNEEHDKVLNALQINDFKRLLFNRVNTVVDGLIKSYIAGGDTTINVTYDKSNPDNPIPISEEIQ